MKKIAITAATIRVCEVRWTWVVSPAASGQGPHRSASACRGRNWPTSRTTTPLKMKKAERTRGEEGAAAGPLQHPHRHLLDPQPLAHRQLQRLDLGEVGRVVLAEQRHHPAVGRPHAAGRVGEALPRRQGEEEAEDAGPDPPREGRPVVVAWPTTAPDRGSASRSPGRRGRLHLGEQARHLLGRVLAVGVEVGAGVVALAQRVEVAGLQRRAEALVEGQGGDQGAGLARPRARWRRWSRRRRRGCRPRAARLRTSAITAAIEASSFQAGMKTRVRTRSILP